MLFKYNVIALRGSSALVEFISLNILKIKLNTISDPTKRLKLRLNKFLKNDCNLLWYFFELVFLNSLMFEFYKTFCYVETFLNDINGKIDELLLLIRWIQLEVFGEHGERFKRKNEKLVIWNKLFDVPRDNLVWSQDCAIPVLWSSNWKIGVNKSNNDIYCLVVS